MAGTKHPNGHWQCWENVETELRKLMMTHHGLIPSGSVFRELGLSGLQVAINTYYGGLRSVRERLGVSLKLCGGCQQPLPLSSFRMRNSKKGPHRDSICIQCSSSAVDAYRATWRGKAAEMHRRARERAKGLGREYTLTKEWIFNRMVSGGFKCEVTGIDIVPDTRGSGVGFRNRFGPSLDRIDSARGYTEDNVRVVANRTNIALGDLSDDQFEEFAVGFLKTRGWTLTRGPE